MAGGLEHVFDLTGPEREIAPNDRRPTSPTVGSVVGVGARRGPSLAAWPTPRPSGCAGARARRTGCCPTPSRARSATRCSPPTTTSSSRRDMFDGRLPAKFAGLGAEGRRDRRRSRGLAVRRQDLLPGRAQRGRRPQDAKTGRSSRPASRRCAPACYDVDARVRDMDINGVWASVNFPSQITGFCGSVFSRCSDPELGLAVTRGVERLVLRRVVLAAPRPHGPDGHHVPRRRRARRASEIRRNAARGFTAVTLPEMPHRIGMEPIFSEWWDPIIAACAETDTVDLPARRVDRRRRHAAGRADGAARRDAVRSAVARARARSGCGRATR